MAKSLSKSESSIFASLQAPGQNRTKEESVPKKETEHKEPIVEKTTIEKPVIEKPVIEKDTTLSEKKDIKETIPPISTPASAAKIKEDAPVIMPNFMKKKKERKTIQHTVTLRPSQESKITKYLEAYEINFNEFIGRLIDSLPEM